MTGKKEKHAPLAFRLDETTLKRLGKLAERVSQPGMQATRADALRIAVQRGLDELEAESRSKR